MYITRNNNPPVFSNTSCDAPIQASITQNSPVTSVIATDSDTQVRVVFTRFLWSPSDLCLSVNPQWIIDYQLSHVKPPPSMMEGSMQAWRLVGYQPSALLFELSLKLPYFTTLPALPGQLCLQWATGNLLGSKGSLCSNIDHITY